MYLVLCIQGKYTDIEKYSFRDDLFLNNVNVNIINIILSNTFFFKKPWKKNASLIAHQGFRTI